MANQRHVDILLRDGVKIWNLWRKEEPEIVPDLSGANLQEVDLSRANLSGANLHEANLSEARLRETDLCGANLSEAHLRGVNLSGADLHKANLSDADLSRTSRSPDIFASDEEIRSQSRSIRANLSWADLSGADLNRANLSGADLNRADLSGADLTLANLSGADLNRANLSGACICYVNLSRANLIEANLSRANLNWCIVYGVSAWDVCLDDTIQTNLFITSGTELPITVDNLEVAQFLYLLLHNDKARAVLDTITSKVVLILGRFGEHKVYLNAVREALRNHPNSYIPVLFDFDPQADRPILETVKILAHLARFVIADLTDPRMVRSELQYIIPNVPTVPVQPIVEGDSKLLTEYSGWRKDYKSFLRVYRYADLDDLLANLTAAVIEPVEAHVQARRLSSDDPDID